MSLQQWHENGWLKEHRTDLQELSNLLAIADRDIAELLEFVRELRADVISRLRAKYPALGVSAEG